MARGGKRLGAGRPKLDNVRVEFWVPRAAFDQLIERERQAGRYRTRIAADILVSELIGGVVTR
jgi:hypothetical protein